MDGSSNVAICFSRSAKFEYQEPAEEIDEDEDSHERKNDVEEVSGLQREEDVSDDLNKSVLEPYRDCDKGEKVEEGCVQLKDELSGEYKELVGDVRES